MRIFLSLLPTLVMFFIMVGFVLARAAETNKAPGVSAYLFYTFYNPIFLVGALVSAGATYKLLAK